VLRQKASLAQVGPRHFGRLRMGLLLGIPIAAAAAFALFLALGNRGAAAAPAAGDQPSTVEKPPVMVTVAPVEMIPIQRSVDTVGSFQGFEEVAVTPKVGGRAVKIHHHVQDIVHSGDLLLEIDPTDYKLAVEEARKALVAELAKIGCLALPPENVDCKQFVAGLPVHRRAVNLEQNAQHKLQRAKSLRQNHAISEEDLEQCSTDFEVAKAAREQVEIDVMSTVASARQKHAQLTTALQHLADTQVEVPQARIEADEVDQSGARCVPNAISEYVVSERMVSEGEMVVANAFTSQPVYRLVADKKLKLSAAVSERYMGQVKLGQEVEVHVEAYPEQVFHGKVRRIHPTVDRLSRTFQVEIHVPNPDRLLRVGGFAKLSIITQRDARAMAVPLEAVVSFAGVNKVFVIRDGKAHAVEVSLGNDGSDKGHDGKRWVEVTAEKASELSPNSSVITSGQTQLAEDVRAEVRK
jgi:multidrug efflux pump subunit AcrA (membrane-fusion protein)